MRIRSGSGAVHPRRASSALKAGTPVRAEGRVIQAGRRAAFSEADLRGLDGTLYATATSTCLVMERP